MNASFPNQAQQGPRSPEEDASFISRLTYWWIRPLFKIGYQRQLQEHDVYEVLDRYRAGVVGKKLAAAWMAEVERAQQRQQRLFE
ncbi:Multidrug resistance-associated protein 4, partial [Actinomortierella ambigua]